MTDPGDLVVRQLVEAAQHDVAPETFHLRVANVGTTGGLGLAAKLLLVLGVGTSIVIGGVFLRESKPFPKSAAIVDLPPSPRLPEVPLEVVRTSMGETATLKVNPAPPPQTREPAKKRAVLVRKTTDVIAATKPEVDDDFAEQLSLLEQVQSALDRRAWDEGLKLERRYHHRFSEREAFAPEALALEVRLLVGAGRLSEARHSFQKFKDRFSSHPAKDSLQDVINEPSSLHLEP